MSEKIFLRILILCGIWSQAISGAFADEEIKQSSDFLIRQKRVVSYLEGEDIQVRINQAPYVVRIKEFGRNKCVGSILSQYVVITAAPCVQMDPVHYKIVSSAAHLNNGDLRDVTEIRRRIDGPESPHRRIIDGVALLIVSPWFVYTSFCSPIKLHTVPMAVGSLGKVYGWGYNYDNRNENRGTNITKSLRSIEVPVISHQNCVNWYRPHREISEKTICTYHPRRHNGHIDSGAGLIVDNHLAGIFLWSGLVVRQIDPRYPDVYVNLHDSYYNQWISINVQTINLRYRNHHNG